MQLSHAEQAPFTSAVLTAYRDFISTIGAGGSEYSIERAISAIAPIDRFYVSERTDLVHRPHLIAHRLESRLASRMGDYMNRYFRGDPVARALDVATEDGATVILRVGPTDIGDTEYRRRFFEEPKIIDRLSFVQRASDRWLILNVARREPAGRFSDDELNSLASLSQLLLPLAARHAQLEPAPNRPRVLSVDELETRFGASFPELSTRERQVCARTVLGMTSEATSLDLGIGIGSVQTYRKRAFQRLEICSAFQLAHLILH